MARILVFGDSITYGAWDKDGGWVDRLKKFLHEKVLSNSKYFLVYNLGISDDTTEDLLERFESETKKRIKEEEKNIIIFSIGTNDSQYMHKTKTLRIKAEIFQQNIRKLINLAKKYSDCIVFTGLLLVDETKTDPIPWVPEKSYKNEYIKQFNEILRSVCKEEKLFFIDLSIEKDLLYDGVHPNTEGHKQIFERVKEYLIEHNII